MARNSGKTAGNGHKLQAQLIKQVDNLNLKDNGVFYVRVDRDKIWDLYLAGFSEENRQEHNCTAELPAMLGLEPHHLQLASLGQLILLQPGLFLPHLLALLKLLSHSLLR